MKFQTESIAYLLSTAAMLSPSSVYSATEQRRQKQQRHLRSKSDIENTSINVNNNNINDRDLSGEFVEPTGEIAYVVGGDSVDAGEYPYFVLTGGCGASLIAPNVVLTAAHCDPQSLVNEVVMVGATKRNSLNNGNFKDAKLIKVSRAVSHPRYGLDGSGINNDFALLLLEESYVIDSNVKLVLNDNGSVPADGDVLDVFGLGATSEGGGVSGSLMDVQVPAMSNNQCRQYYGPGSITDKMLCAGYQEGQRDSCQGDSGGPIVKKVGNVHYQVGVVSWGDGCARENRPGVYSRVSAEVDWIKSVACDEWNARGDLCGPPPPTPAPTNPPGCDSSSQLKINFDFDSYSQDISWKVTTQGTSNIIAEKDGYGQSQSSALETVTVCNNQCYTATITDSYLDGLCCEYGNGSYTMQLGDGTVLQEGAQFGATATKDFCLDESGNLTNDIDIDSNDNNDNDDDIDSCEDRADFLFKGRDGKDCEWVAKKPFGKKGRCKKKDSDKTKVKNICKFTCDEC